MKNSDAIPKHLTGEARRLWQRLTRDFAIDDAAGLTLLRAACEAFARGEQARRMLKREGMFTRDRFGQRRPHPAVQIERDCRTQLIAALRALKLAPEDL